MAYREPGQSARGGSQGTIHGVEVAHLWHRIVKLVPDALDTVVPRDDERLRKSCLMRAMENTQLHLAMATIAPTS